jgi:hypothetical protein
LGFRPSKIVKRSAYLVLAALSATVLICRAAIPHPSIPAIGSLDGLGVNIHFTDAKPGELEMIKAAGFKWVRMDLAWGGTERKQGEYDFAAYDRLVDALEKNGLRAVFILDYGNPLYDSGLAPHTDEGGAAFAKWAATAVKRYAGKGYLWELWNEPNIAQFWKPKPDVQQYIALTKRVAAELRSAGLIDNQKSKIENTEAFIGPATSTIDLKFLEDCFKAGLLEDWAAVSVHPYRQKPPETVEEEYRSVRLLIAKYGPKGKAIPVLSGEWGYSDAWPAGAPDSDIIDRQFLTNIANDIPLSIWYDWRDDGTDPKEPEHHFGLVQHESVKGENLPFRQKAAYNAVKTLAEELSGYRFSKRLLAANVDLGDKQEARLLLFTRKPDEQKLVLWSMKERADHYVQVPASHGFFRVSGVNKPVSDRVTAGDEGINIDAMSRGVKYLTPEEPNDFLRVAAATPRFPLEYVFRWPEPAENNMEVSSGLRESIKNPLDRPIKLILGFHNNFPIKPGEEFGLNFRAPNQRAALERYTSGSSVELSTGQTLPLTQETMIVCTNPIDAEVLPPASDALIVRILNPSGDPAVLNIRDGDAQADASVPVQFAKGERQKTVRLPLTAPFTKLRRVNVAISEKLDDQSSSGYFDVLNRESGEWLSLPQFDAATMKGESDGDAKTDATYRFESSAITPPETGSPAVKLTYHFSRGWKFIEASAPFPPIAPSGLERGFHTDWPKTFIMWLHGDGKGCQARIRFKDASGQTFQGDGPKIDFTGWRVAKFPMQPSQDHHLAHWGGANDGIIHYPIAWESIFLLDNISREAVEGEIHISAPTLIY